MSNPDVNDLKTQLTEVGDLVVQGEVIGGPQALLRSPGSLAVFACRTFVDGTGGWYATL